MSRVRQIQWKPAARAARKDEIPYPSEGNKAEKLPQEDTHETTVLDCSALYAANARCPASLGSSISNTRPLERELMSSILKLRILEFIKHGSK